MAGRKAWSLHDTNRDTILCLTRGLARYALWCQEVSVASWYIKPPRMSIWKDDLDQPFFVFFETAFNNFFGELEVMLYKAKSDMWSLGCILYASRQLQTTNCQWVVWWLDIGFQVKEMVALRPPFRAEDMEGLYRISNTIRLQIVLDSTSLFPTFAVWRHFCWPLIFCPELLVDRQSGPWPIPSHPCTL